VYGNSDNQCVSSTERQSFTDGKFTREELLDVEAISGTGGARVNDWSKRKGCHETAGANSEQKSVTVDAVTETRRCLKGGGIMNPKTILLVFGCGMGFVLAYLFILFKGGMS
jgi:hypothetical protein